MMVEKDVFLLLNRTVSQANTAGLQVQLIQRPKGHVAAAAVLSDKCIRIGLCFPFGGKPLFLFAMCDAKAVLVIKGGIPASAAVCHLVYCHNITCFSIWNGCAG